ncbi:MAG: hypothetical protein EA398_02490 [Deltaproteobacteria bacterium]|nr:MAG: hypothetical protein EA398_02490 [Deltaproteobacteria bacterium]
MPHAPIPVLLLIVSIPWFLSACIHMTDPPDRPISVTDVAMWEVDGAGRATSSVDPGTTSGYVLTLTMSDYLDLPARIRQPTPPLLVDGQPVASDWSWSILGRSLRIRFRAPSDALLVVDLPDEAFPGVRNHATAPFFLSGRVHQILDDHGAAIPPPRDAVSFSTHLAPRLERACGHCHGAPGASLTALRPDALRLTPSNHDDSQFLVVPFDPASSVLLHLLLADYPLADGRRKPPPFDPQPVVDPDLPLLLHDWIAAGAPDG